jgi:CrcB protein
VILAMRTYIAVGCGAAVGALARYLATIGIGGMPNLGLLWATVSVNVLGSFVIGVFAALTGPEGRLLVSPAARQFVMSGLCGGFTTFSLASLDTFILVEAGNTVAAGIYVTATVVLSLAAVWLGHMLAAGINR